MNDSKKIFREDDEAAQRKTVTGWVSRNGVFYGDDERGARYAGATHLICDGCCGEVAKNSYCQPCRTKDRRKKYEEKEFKEWDLKEPVVIFDTDDYFFDLDYFLDHCADQDMDPEEVELVICKPNIASELDDDIYCDDLAEDHLLEDSAPELAAKIAELNSFIRDGQFALSWMPGKFKTKYKKP